MAETMTYGRSNMPSGNGAPSPRPEISERPGTERITGLAGGLFHEGHVTGLTADERSEEWLEGNQWY